jgi:pyrrolysine biosynthesis protein PylC
VRVGIIGGNLQGVEAAYLARKAGWEITLIDRKPVVPSQGLCDRFIQLEVTDDVALAGALDGVDLVIPALENDKALACLEQWTGIAGIPFAFDTAAYATTSSKAKSNRLFTLMGIPAPKPWPDCKFPVIAKPSMGSGSHGVLVFNETNSLQNHMNESNEEWVLQEFLRGPSYSLEVIGSPGQHVPLQVTDLGMDPVYDCKRVISPTELPEQLISDFEKMSLSLADALGLKGVMDVEVILDNNTLKVLEIDARLPSQTPTAVFWSTGQNIVQLLADLFSKAGELSTAENKIHRGIVYEHIKVEPNVLAVAGEHIMSGTNALHIHENFFGADEAITNYSPNRDVWVATLINCEDTRKAAWEKRNRVIKDIRQHFNLEVYCDSGPKVNIGETDSDQAQNRRC